MASSPSDTTLDVRYFDPRKMRPGAVVLVVGRRGSGKSTLCADLLSYQRALKRGICVSATEKANPYWVKHVPRCFIYEQYSDSVLQGLFAMQQRCKDTTGVMEGAFCVLDDLLYDKSFARSKEVRRVLMNGRHCGLFTLITCQYLVDVGPDLRANVDYVFCLRDPIRANREKVYTHFAGQFKSFEAFDQVMVACTEGNECIVLDQGCLSYNLSDSVFFYRATPGLEYRIGAPEYWKFSEREEGPVQEDERAERRPGDLLVRKRYPKKAE